MSQVPKGISSRLQFLRPKRLEKTYHVRVRARKERENMTDSTNFAYIMLTWNSVAVHDSTRQFIQTPRGKTDWTNWQESKNSHGFPIHETIYNDTEYPFMPWIVEWEDENKSYLTLKADLWARRIRVKRLDKILYATAIRSGYHIPPVDEKGVGKRPSLRFATFEGMQLEMSNFDRTDLTYATFVNCFLMYADFTNADLKFARFIHCNLMYSKLINVSLFGTTFSDCALDRAVLDKNNYDYSVFHRCSGVEWSIE